MYHPKPPGKGEPGKGGLQNPHREKLFDPKGRGREGRHEEKRENRKGEKNEFIAKKSCGGPIDKGQARHSRGKRKKII